MVGKKARNAINESKSYRMEKQAEEGEVSLNRNNSKMAHAVVKKLCGIQVDGTKWKPARLIEDSNGNLLTKQDAIPMRWKEYSEELYNCEIQKDLQVLHEPVQIEETRDDEKTLLVVV